MASEKTSKAVSRPFSERLKDNAVVVLASVAVAVGSVTFGAVKFLFDRELAVQAARHDAELKASILERDQRIFALTQEIETAKRTAEERSLSIEFDLAGSTPFDVRDFFILDADQTNLSSDAIYYEDGGFYALPDVDGWMHQKHAPSSFAEYVMRQDNPLYLMIQGMAPKDQPATLHVWRGSTEMTVEGSSPYRRLFPYISVERTRHTDILQSIQRLEQNVLHLERGDDFIEIANKMYRGDSMAFFLGGKLGINNLVMNMFPNIEYTLQNIGKVKNIVYMKTMTTIKDTTIGGTRYEMYYIFSQNIVISTPDSIWSVITSVPSAEPIPRQQFAIINGWLKDFRVVLR